MHIFHEQPERDDEQLSAYLDGVLAADERAAVEAHLAGCDACQTRLAQLREVRALLRALPQPALPRSFLLPLDEEAAGKPGEVPVADEVPAPVSESSPVSEPEPEPEPEPVPLHVTRPAGTRAVRVARVARVAQWVGAIAAVLALGLFISTMVLGQGKQEMATSAYSPMTGATGGAATSSTSSAADGSATATNSATLNNDAAKATATEQAATPVPTASQQPTELTPDAAGAPTSTAVSATFGQFTAPSAAPSPTPAPMSYSPAVLVPPGAPPWLQLGAAAVFVVGLLLVVVSRIVLLRLRG